MEMPKQQQSLVADKQQHHQEVEIMAAQIQQLEQDPLPMENQLHLSQFSSFQKLPKELREKIWDLASAPDAPHLAIVHTVRPKYFSAGDHPADYEYKSNQPRSPLLYACPESRNRYINQTRRVFAFGTYVNFDTDAIYMHSFACPYGHPSLQPDNYREKFSKDGDKIQWLVVNWVRRERSHRPTPVRHVLMGAMPQLRRISQIYDARAVPILDHNTRGPQNLGGLETSYEPSRMSHGEGYVMPNWIHRTEHTAVPFSSEKPPYKIIHDTLSSPAKNIFGILVAGKPRGWELIYVPETAP